MGYELHITRAELPEESEQSPISLAEWLAYIRNDPEMRLDGQASAQVADGSKLVYESEGLAVWTAYTGHDENGNKAWFDWREGCVCVKNPDKEIITKMKQVARNFSAGVIGEEGEEY